MSQRAFFVSKTYWEVARCLGDFFSGQTLEGSYRYGGSGSRVVGKFRHDFEGFGSIGRKLGLSLADVGQKLGTDVGFLLSIAESLKVGEGAVGHLLGWKVVDAF